MNRFSVVSNMIPKCITFLMNVFDFCGFCTQQKPSKRYQRLISIIFVLHIILAIVNTLIFIEYLNNQTIDTLGQINDAAKFSFQLSVYWFSIWEMYSKRELQKLFFDCFRRIDIHFNDHQSFQLCSYRLKFLAHQLLGGFVRLISLRRVIGCGRITLGFWCSYVFILIFIQNRIFYFLFYLEFIKYQLNTILSFTKRMSELSQITECCNFKAEYTTGLKWIREYYQLVYDISLNMNKVFGWSNLVTISFLFVICLADCNWFYWKWYNRNISIITYSLYWNQINCQTFKLFTCIFYWLRIISNFR